MPAALVLIAPATSQAAFAPTFSVALEPPTAGLVPQVTAAVGQADGLRRFTLRFPAGFAVNRSLSVPRCSASDQFLRACPDAASIGTVNGTVPAAGVYLAEGNPVRIVTFLRGQLLTGTFEEGSGTLNISFDGFPPTGFPSFTMHLRGGEQGLVRAPSACGRSTVMGNFTSWTGELAVAEAPVAVTGCAEAARVSGVRVTPAKFRPTVFDDPERPSGGASLVWRLSQAAAGTRIFIERRSGRRWHRLGSLLGSGDEGSNVLRFDGRFRNRALAAGVYHFVLQPRGGDAVASPRFEVVGRRS
jgi:hypothetical protein